MAQTAEGASEAVEKIRFSFMTDEDVRLHSVVNITTPILLDSVDRPVHGGFMILPWALLMNISVILKQSEVQYKLTYGVLLWTPKSEFLKLMHALPALRAYKNTKILWSTTTGKFVNILTPDFSLMLVSFHATPYPH